MKKKLPYIFCIILIAILIGYGVFITNKNQNIKTTGLKNTKSEAKIVKKEQFFGRWKVIDKIATTRIYALEDSEINEFINSEIEYSPFKVEFGGKSIQTPVYKINMLDEKAFFENCGYTNLNEIGVSEKSIKEVSVYNKSADDEKNYYYGFGGTFYIKDHNTIIVLYEGVYFELTRSK